MLIARLQLSRAALALCLPLALVACSGAASDGAADGTADGTAAADTAPGAASAVLVGTRPANPPSAPLSGLVLEGQLFTASGAALFWSVPFGPTDTDIAHITATIESATAGSVHGSDDGVGHLRLVTAAAGNGVALYAFSSGAGSVLGFDESVGAEGGSAAR